MFGDARADTTECIVTELVMVTIQGYIFVRHSVRLCRVNEGKDLGNEVNNSVGQFTGNIRMERLKLKALENYSNINEEKREVQHDMNRVATLY